MVTRYCLAGAIIVLCGCTDSIDRPQQPARKTIGTEGLGMPAASNLRSRREAASQVHAGHQNHPKGPQGEVFSWGEHPSRLSSLVRRRRHLAVDSYTGLGSPDSTVIAIDSDGKKLAASTREFRGTGQSGRPLRRGNCKSFTIPLSYYCRLEKPGKYCIRAAHNLYWTDRDAAFAEDDPRWAETIIKVSMPDDAQAKQVVEQMLRAKEDVVCYPRAFCTWSTEEYADFACLRYPVYLPILEKMAADTHGDRRPLLRHRPQLDAGGGAGAVAAVEDREQGTIKRIAAALIDRLPEPKGVNRPDRCNPLRIKVADDGVTGPRDADPRLVKPWWRGEFTVRIRRSFRTSRFLLMTPRSSGVQPTCLRPSGYGRMCPTLPPP